MKKSIKLIISCLLLSVCCFCVVGCCSNKSIDNNNSDDDVTVKIKSTADLIRVLSALTKNLK